MWYLPPSAATPCLVWRQPWPHDIRQAIVSVDNKTSTISNSDLELAAIVCQFAVVAQCSDVRERTLATPSDNTPAISWFSKGSTTTTGPAAYLLRAAALHQRTHRYVAVAQYIAGPANTMADSASRAFHLSDTAFLSHFALSFPQPSTWSLQPLAPETFSIVISALRTKQPNPLSPLAAAETTTLFGTDSGLLTSVPWGTPIPYLPKSLTRSRFSKSSASTSEMADLASAASRSAVTAWLRPSKRWQRRSPTWGPLTHDTYTHTNSTWTRTSHDNSKDIATQTQRLPE